jgi:hypothetical protein
MHQVPVNVVALCGMSYQVLAHDEKQYPSAVHHMRCSLDVYRKRHEDVCRGPLAFERWVSQTDVQSAYVNVAVSVECVISDRVIPGHSMLSTCSENEEYV